MDKQKPGNNNYKNLPSDRTNRQDEDDQQPEQQEMEEVEYSFLCFKKKKMVAASNKKSIKRILTRGSSSLQTKAIDEEEFRRQRARENWGKLRKHIKQMRNKANFLVTWLDGENEMK